MAYSLTSLVDRVRQSLGGAVAQAPTTLAGLGDRISSNFNWAGQQAQQNIVKPVQQVFNSPQVKAIGNLVSSAGAISDLSQGLQGVNEQMIQPTLNLVKQGAPSAIKIGVQTFPGARGAVNTLNQFGVKTPDVLNQAPRGIDLLNIAGLAGAIKIVPNMVGGYMGAGFKAGENLLSKQPLTQGIGDAYNQGFQFSAQLGPIEKFTSWVATPVLSKLKQASPIIDKVITKLTPGEVTGFKSWISESLKQGNKSGLSMSVFGALQDAKNPEEALKNVWDQYKMGFAFGGGSKAVETAIPGLVKPTLKLGAKGVDLYKNGPYGNGQSGMVGNPRYIHPEDYALYDSANTLLHQKSKYTPAEIRKATEDIRLIGEKYLPVADLPADGNPMLIANRLTKRMARGDLPTPGNVGSVDLNAKVDTGIFKPPYERGDIGKIQAELEKMLGVPPDAGFKQKQSILGQNFAMLQQAADAGAPGAAEEVMRAKELFSAIELAQKGKATVIDAKLNEPIGPQATKGKVPDPTQSLLTEARKYKSAEEFVKGQEEKLVNEFQSILDEVKRLPKKKTLNLKEYGMETKLNNELARKGAELTKFSQSKSQLADIYNQATKGVEPLSIQQAKAQGMTFDEWVKGQGETVYHGTNRDFTAFEKAKSIPGHGNNGAFGNGFYFTDKLDYAKKYADYAVKKTGGVGRVEDVNINLNKPFIIDKNTPIDEIKRLAESKADYSSLHNPKSPGDTALNYIIDNPQKFTANLKAEGYGGVIATLNHGKGDFKEINVFDPSKIKTRSQLKAEWDKVGGKSSPEQPIPSSKDLAQISEKTTIPTQTQQVGIQKPPENVLSSSSQPYFNTERLNIDEKSKGLVAKAVTELKPAIEAKVGTKLTNKEVVEVANRSARIINTAVDRQQTLNWEAALLKTRQKLAAMSQSGTVDQEYLDTLMSLKSSATDISRKLQSFSIGADPKMVTAKEAILEAVLKTEKDASKVLEAANGVNFNDFKQATEFYRKFVQPTGADWLTTLRYNSMLSSPNTHINNMASNFQGTGIIAPIEKTITGMVDKIVSGVTGRPRQYLTGEGLAYAKGYYSNIKSAIKAFSDVMSGKKMIENADIREIPMATKGTLAGVENALKLPMKLLEASDQFFTALTEGGSKSALDYKASRGIRVKDPALTAQNEAAKRLFRSELGVNSGSTVLDAIDIFANTVQGLKNSSNPIMSNIAKFTLPFIRTPTNILKQGVEYSPLGVTTLVGSSTKTEQISKAILGSSVAAATALLVSTDRLTWAEPTSDKQKQMFRAAGMQPYSVKVGDTWVSYSKLHPAVSFNMALVAAVKHSLDDKKLNEDEATTVLNGLAKWLNFYVDQSYMKNVGDFVAGVKGDVEGMAKIPANYTQQTIPYRALMGWVARLTDPYQRKVDPGGTFLDKQLQQIAAQIPMLSQSVPARLDQNGNPIENQSRVLNSILPARISTEIQPQKQEYEDYMNKLKKSRAIKDATSGVGYVDSKDAPQNIIETVGTYGKSVITDPGQTINAVLAGNPIRKVEGGAVILERQNGLGAMDKGNKATQVDHIIALTLGGTNSKDNLQVLTKEENMIKGQVETRLYKLMKSGQITKEEAQKRDLNWKNEVSNLPKQAQEQLVSDLSVSKSDTKTSANAKQPTLKLKAPKKASTGTKKATNGKTKRITVKMGKVPKVKSIKIKMYRPKVMKAKPLKLNKLKIRA